MCGIFARERQRIPQFRALSLVEQRNQEYDVSSSLGIGVILATSFGCCTHTRHRYFRVRPRSTVFQELRDPIYVESLRLP